MVRAVYIGDRMLSAVLLLKADSVNDFDLSFWEDPAEEDPADLTGVTASLELTPNGDGAPVSFPATVASNKVTWHLTDVESDFGWRYGTYRIKFTKLGETDIVVAGPVRMQ